MKEVVEPGRVDQLAIAAARSLVGVAEQVSGVSLWNAGVGDIVREAVAESALPKHPVTPVELARHLGVLQPDPACRRRLGRAARRRAERGQRGVSS